MELIKKYAWAGMLGLTLGIAGINILTWQYWVIFIPTAILVIWSQNEI